MQVPAQTYKIRFCEDMCRGYFLDLQQIWIPSLQLTVHMHQGKVMLQKVTKSQAGRPSITHNGSIDGLEEVERDTKRSRVEPEEKDILLDKSVVDDIALMWELQCQFEAVSGRVQREVFPTVSIPDA